MITTVITATTVVTVTTVTTVTVVATKEVSGAARPPFGTRLARFMNVSVWPLAIIFGIFVVVKILESIP